jgi:hypothetical protein
MNDELTLLLDHLEANIQQDNARLREIYEAKQKICQEYVKRLKIHNRLLNEIKKLHLGNQKQNQIIIKAIHASFQSLKQDLNILERDHLLFSDLLQIWIMKNGNGNKQLEELLSKTKSQHQLNIHAGDKTHQLHVTSIGGDNAGP